MSDLSDQKIAKSHSASLTEASVEEDIRREEERWFESLLLARSPYPPPPAVPEQLKTIVSTPAATTSACQEPLIHLTPLEFVTLGGNQGRGRKLTAYVLQYWQITHVVSLGPRPILHKHPAVQYKHFHISSPSLSNGADTARCVQANATPSQFYHSSVAHLNATGNSKQDPNTMISSYRQAAQWMTQVLMSGQNEQQKRVLIQCQSRMWQEWSICGGLIMFLMMQETGMSYPTAFVILQSFRPTLQPPSAEIVDCLEKAFPKTKKQDWFLRRPPKGHEDIIQWIVQCRSALFSPPDD
jgi:hypothetical protein